MYCMNCGGQVPDQARFCATCGATVDTEVTRLAPSRQASEPSVLPARDTGPGGEIEQVVFTARPTALFVGLGYAAAALGAILLVVLLSIPRLGISPLISVPLALALLLIPAYYHLRRNTIRYTLTDSKIEIDRGFVSRTTRNIPLRNIQNVTVSAGLVQRLLGFGNVIIDDASEQTGGTVLGNIPEPRRHADLLLRELRRWR
ncbi:MAG: PH domain-containing protein [Pyrinomonadaceae bacterium]